MLCSIVHIVTDLVALLECASTATIVDVGAAASVRKSTRGSPIGIERRKSVLDESSPESLSPSFLFHNPVDRVSGGGLPLRLKWIECDDIDRKHREIAGNRIFGSVASRFRRIVCSNRRYSWVLRVSG